MLIIVESPAKAKTIQSIVGRNHVVKASIGHIRQISNDKKTKDGRKLEINGIDIERKFDPIFEVDPKKKSVVSELKKLAKTNNNQILFATDSDREGEAISWHLAQILGVKDNKLVQRLEFHEITKSAITEALANPRPLDVDLVEAQKARQVLDKLVGYKLSPVLWSLMGNRNLSAGRVQTPALSLIYLREKEIEKFISEEYWNLGGRFSDVMKTNLDIRIKLSDEESKIDEANLFTLKKILGQAPPKEIKGQKTVDEIFASLSLDRKFRINKMEARKQTIHAKPPFTTSTLQQAASSRLGMTPRSAMRTAQQLYEGVVIDGEPRALITYMRTDSVNLSNESIDAARNYLSTAYPQFIPSKPNYYKGKSKNAQEAHEAIRPTSPSLTPAMLRSKLDPQLWKLYDLIWRQMVSSQMTPEIREITSIELENDSKSLFTGSITKSVELGYKAVAGFSEKETQIKLTLKEGEYLSLNELIGEQKFTNPPARYSQASLIKMLESLGIGRPSTYASIISTLQDRAYVEDDNKSMKPTAVGMVVAQALTENFPAVTSSTLTAEMEDHLDEISRGEDTYLHVLTEFWTGFKYDVESKSDILYEKKQDYKTVMGVDKIERPDGKGMMILKIGRFGEYWQGEDDKAYMLPKNFIEIEQALNQAESQHRDKLTGLVSPVSKDPLIIRVSKASLNPYVSTAKYRVGDNEMALNIEKLEERGWTQETVDQMYADKEKNKSKGKGGKGRFGRWKKSATSSGIKKTPKTFRKKK